MHSTALRSAQSYSRKAHDRAEKSAEKAEDAEMAAMIAWAHMRVAQERLRTLGKMFVRAALQTAEIRRDRSTAWDCP